VVALPVPKPYGARFVSPREIEACLPDAVGAFVHWLVRDSGWTVTERRNPDRRVPLAPRHVCILFRRFVSFGEDITRRYVEALEARGIRHLLVGGKAFHDREEIETLRAALMAIEWPDDQLSVFATLRGALFALGDDELFEYHALHHRFHPFRLPDAEAVPAHLAPVRQALATLAELHRQRNRRPVADTIARLLEETRAHVGFVLRPAGEQALANVLHVAELARQYELDGGMSFRGFVETLQSEAAGPAAEAPILEEGSDGVRLMTVHKAKGLEFPVVILADITARLTPYDAGRYIDTTRRLCALRLGGWSPRDLNEHRDLELARERREGERVAYVAATRARDLLVVPAIGDEPYTEGWASPLNAAIYPEPGSCRHQVQAEGCPVFTSRDSVLERPDGDPARSTTVCPGRHDLRTADGEHTVVWWSPEPAVLPLDAHAPFGLRRDDLIVKDVPPTVLRRRLDTYTAWRQTRTAAIESASIPSVSVVTATEAALAGSAASRFPLPDGDSKAGGHGIEAEVLRLEGPRTRPRGRRFGSLVHALLAEVPLDHPAVLKQLSDAHGRLLGAPSSEVRAAHALVTRALAHPLLQQAARAARDGRCLRETPVTLRVRGDDGAATLVEGTVDLAFHTGSGFVVVDFKTDAPADDVLERYRRQVALYAHAIQLSTGDSVRAVLMTM
jgi:ATP-dependent exoDNAse (exonuclease V) beta subunit